ncbi:hypothetical protein [Streptomyces sp. ERV7]|uniref:hypothetical protein n=1 Tax=Streptomyces sp. ERV7 TaxID=1322334 RepID=UPI00131B6BAE|nr:hypothetical protein [Streptomyces sp. ERV7]
MVWAGRPRPGQDVAGVVGAGECEGWAFGPEYGDGTALHQLRAIPADIREAYQIAHRT